MEIKEDVEHSKVSIDGFVIDGFVDSEACDNCNSNRIYHDHFDAYFCPACNVWLEDTCSDKDCTNCKDRPEKPLTKNQTTS